MIANVSPSINTFDDTYNTLKYANRAKNIKTMVNRNVLNARYHISNYVNIINYDEIIDFSLNNISVKYHNKIISIEGHNLIISKMVQDEVLITGEISNVRIN